MPELVFTALLIVTALGLAGLCLVVVYRLFQGRS